MRPLAAALLVAVLTASAAACSSAPAPAPAASAAPAEALVFAGLLAGTLSNGIDPLQFSRVEPSQAPDGTVTHTACASFDVKDMSGMDWGNTYEIAIYGRVGTHNASLVVTLDSEIKPSGTVPFTGRANQGAMASLNATGSSLADASYLASDASSSITFDPGSRSGSIQLHVANAPFGPTVETVAGTWRCP